MKVEKSKSVGVFLGKNWLFGQRGKILSWGSKVTALAAGFMWSKGVIDRIIFSTGKTGGENGFSEAAEMKKFVLRFFSIPEEIIFLEEVSIDTQGNAREICKFLQENEIVRVCTVTYHLSRVKNTFRRVFRQNPKAEKIFFIFLSSSDEYLMTLLGLKLTENRSIIRATLKKYFLAPQTTFEKIREWFLNLFWYLDKDGKLMGRVTKIIRH